MRGGVAPPAKSDEVHRMVCTAPSTRLDVVNLESVRGVTEGAAETVPPVYLFPEFF